MNTQYNFQNSGTANPPTRSFNRTTTATKTAGEMRPITSNASAGFQKSSNLGTTAERFAQKVEEADGTKDQDQEVRVRD